MSKLQSIDSLFVAQCRHEDLLKEFKRPRAWRAPRFPWVFRRYGFRVFVSRQYGRMKRPTMRLLCRLIARLHKWCDCECQCH